MSQREHGESHRGWSDELPEKSLHGIVPPEWKRAS
jgi:hypothetical protein